MDAHFKPEGCVLCRTHTQVSHTQVIFWIRTIKWELFSATALCFSKALSIKCPAKEELWSRSCPLCSSATLPGCVTAQSWGQIKSAAHSHIINVSRQAPRDPSPFCHGEMLADSFPPGPNSSSTRQDKALLSSLGRADKVVQTMSRDAKDCQAGERSFAFLLT